MPEGDTIHRIAGRLRAALEGKELGRAETPDPRSPIHGRAGQLEGRTFESVEARGKHLIAHFSGDLALHSHLGINGRWRVFADGRVPYGKPWLLLASGRAIAVQSGGKILRLVSESRVRNDPGLMQLGPDPLAKGFDPDAAARRLLASGDRREVGEAILDQRVIAGIGNVIRNEALWASRIDPWRRVGDLEPEEASDLVRANQRVMQISIRRGRRPHNVYRADRRACPNCGGRISVRGQGDANRATYWCPRCQT
ncbi:MAG TPA: DNA-formamidopyrimidine glycosylase family protein [Solirubrobacterales bacterium]